MIRYFSLGFLSVAIPAAILCAIFRFQRPPEDQTSSKASTKEVFASINTASPRAPSSSYNAERKTNNAILPLQNSVSAAEWLKKDTAELISSDFRQFAILDFYNYFSTTRLSSEVKEKLLNLIVQRRLVSGDVQELYSEGKLVNKRELQKTYNDVVTGIDAEISTLLGTEYPAFEAYSNSVPVRAFAATFVQSISSDQLSSEEANDFTAALVESYKDSPARQLLDPYALPPLPEQVGDLFKNRLAVESRVISSLSVNSPIGHKLYQPLFDAYIADLHLAMSR